MTRQAALEHKYSAVEFGSFRIVKLLGEGGMGAVFLAEHKTVDLRAAIKLLRDPLADEAAVARFLDEAQVLSRLDHPGLVRLNDCGALPDGTLYLQMEYLDGQTLLEYVQVSGGKLPLPTVLLFGRQMASALAFVHQERILHRDLKPSNLYVVSDPEVPGGYRVKILDFGIAKLRTAATVSGGALSTESGKLLGTPRYMSPEQCEGTASLDDRSDVYSLGLILFELLTGESPYPEPQQPTGWLYAHVQKRPRALRQLDPSAPKELAALLAQLLDKLASQRPSMAQVESRLSAMLASATSIQPMVRDERKAPWILSAAAGVLLGFTGVAILSKYRASKLARILGISAGVLLSIAGVAILTKYRDPKLPRLRWSKLSPPEERVRSLAALQARAPRGTVVIPGGSFLLGSSETDIDAALQDCHHHRKDCNREEYERERPQHAVTVSDFYLDQYEVTNAEYAAFLNVPLRSTYVEQGRLVRADNTLLVDLHPDASGISYQDGRFQARPGRENQPVVQVTWNGAKEFCAAHGMRLPKEAEWELAARSGNRQPPYPWTNWALSAWPWGDAPPSCDGVVMARDTGQSCQARAGAVDRVSTSGLVGPQDIGVAKQDVTLQSVHDLAGNVREWVEDEFRVPYPDCGTCLNPRVDIAQTTSHTMGVVRGGSFQQEPTAARSAGRSRWRAEYLATGIGFRCATNPEHAPSTQ